MKNWLQAHPFVVLLLPLIAGILFCNRTGFPFDLQKDTAAPWIDTTATFAAVIEDYPVERTNSWRYTAKVYNIYKESQPESTFGRIYLYIGKDSTRALPNIGDCVLFRTKVTRADSIGTFDYGTYLRRQGIAGQAFIRSHWSVIGHTDGGMMLFARRLRHRLIERYCELGISGQELGTLSALTLGYREDLDPDIKRAFQRSGASHILAVSGLHTGIIYMVILALLTCFGRFNPLYEERKQRVAISIIIIIIMAFYAILTGLSPSVCRSVIMLVIVQAAYMFYRRPIALNTIAAAAFIILCLNPNDLFSVSFQLSFAAVLAIIYLEPFFRSLIPIPRTGIMVSPLRYVRGLITVSLAAQLGTLPITLYYFHQICNYFLLTNLIVIPLAFAITITALATLTIGWIPSLGIILAPALKWLTWILNQYTAFIESLPGAYSVL